MTDIDLKPLQIVLADYATRGRTMLLPALHVAQDLFGFVPEEAASEIARELSVPLADVNGVIDFYAFLSKHPSEEVTVHVCDNPACSIAGAETIIEELDTLSGSEQQKPGRKSGFSVDRTPCLGLCDVAPAVLVNGYPFKVTEDQSWEELLQSEGKLPETFVGGELSLLTQNCHESKPTTLQEYSKTGGYAAFKRILQHDPFDVIQTIKESGLVGRGGAAFPTGIKWEGAAKTESEIRYLVCNGDEAEPGTFKDRVLMEKDPHRIIEGMLIAAFGIGASKGYFYIRGEYLNALHIVREALDEAFQANLLGEHILGSDFSFEIELRRGAGAYICGEETALFESIEGKRGFPRVKPPFPTTHGLFGKPTVINNVETLANVPLIFNLGVEEFRKIGTEKSPGPKLFCVSGDVKKPGLYEVPFGVTLRHLIFDLAGGMKKNTAFKTVLLGGAAGAFAINDELDVKLSFEDLKNAGLPLGSGVVTVFDESRDLKNIMLKLAHFFADESCGKCYPCQIGTQRQYEIMQRIANNDIDQNDKDRLLDIIATMTDSSLCGLGQTAGSAINSAIQKWPEYFSNYETGIG